MLDNKVTFYIIITRSKWTAIMDGKLCALFTEKNQSWDKKALEGITNLFEFIV